MEFKLKSATKPLLVVAHPDDESIFFGGLLLKFRHLKWTVVCVTDGNAEGRGAERHQELLAACKKLGVKKVIHWNFADNYPARLPVNELREALKKIEPNHFNTVFTHGALGEYGHPHHQDVSYTVHQFFGEKKIPVWSAAYNSLGEVAVHLSEKDYKLKSQILQEIYPKETSRFLNILQSTHSEYYHKVDPKIVSGIYEWLIDEAKPLPSKLGAYQILKPFLVDRTYPKSSVGFFNNYFVE